MTEIKINTINLLKKHWLIIVLAFIVGSLIVLPTLVSIRKTGLNDFKGIYPVFNDDEVHYLAKAREAVDGHLSLGNVFYYEHKNEPYMQPSLLEIFLAGTSNIFNISIPALFAINDFILPFFGMILLYALFIKLTSSIKISLVSALIFYLIFLYTFGRPINPQLSFLFLVAGIILIWVIIRGAELKNRIIYSLILGGLTGLLVYIYPYFWTALFVAFVFTLLADLNKQNLILYAKLFFGFLAAFIALALPYLINLKNVLPDPFYKESSARMGMLNIHLPSCYINVALVFFALALVYAGRKKYEDRKLKNFSFALLLSAVILNWQNIITGQYLQFSSHYFMVTVLFVYISLIILIKAVIFKIKNSGKTNYIKDLALCAGVIALLFFIALKQYPDLKNGVALAISGINIDHLQGIGKLSDWLNTNTEKDSVVYALCDDCNTYIPIYTGNNLYFYSYGGYYIMSDDEVEDRWARQNIFMDNIDQDHIKAKDRYIWLNKFIDKYQNESMRNKIISMLTGKKSAEPVRVPDIYPARLSAKYEEVKKEDYETALKKYKIDYMILDSSDKKFTGIENKIKKYGFIEPVIKIDNYLIYRVN